MNFDVITMGRSGVDIYPQQTGVSLVDVDTFEKASRQPDQCRRRRGRYGRRTGSSQTGVDPFGNTYTRR